MLDAFKVKSYDLEPVYLSWANPPVFKGTANDDPVVWIEQIRVGCKERKVPKEHWHRVGIHYLGPKPRERINELQKVMMQMTGNQHVWNWKKFKIAMQNLGYVSQRAAEKAKNKPKSPEKEKEREVLQTAQKTKARPMPKKQGSWWVMGKSTNVPNNDSSEQLVVAHAKALPPVPCEVPSPPSLSPSSGAVTTVSAAPGWLVNACTALDFLTSEHPRVMSAMSAILITVGAIPSIPGIGAATGGAFLASGAAQAIGAVASGVGHWMKAQADGQMQVTNGEQPVKA